MGQQKCFVWERANCSPDGMFWASPIEPLPKQALLFTCLRYKSFENTVGKGEIAHNKQFLLFPQCFQNFLPFSSKLKLPSANSLSLEESKICHLGKG